MLPTRTDVAGSRPQSEFDALGIRLGPWTLSPQLKVTAGYVSNLYGVQRDSRGDGFLVYSPSIHVASGWSRDALDLSASGAFTRYFRNPKQNTNEYSIVAQGQLDLGARTKLLPSLTVSQTAEQRGTSGTPLTFGRPSLDRIQSATITAQHQFGEFTASAAATHANERFSQIKLANDVNDSQRFRDSESNGGSVRLAYQLTRDTSAFVSAGYAHAHALQLAGCCQRSSDRITVLGGITTDIGLLRGQVSAGYLEQKFNNAAFLSYSGVTYKGTLYWYPTPLVTVTLDASRSLENSGIINVGALVTNVESLNVDYELMRNLLVHATVTRRGDHFREISTRSTLTSGELSADYEFNRIVSMGVYGRYECRDSSPTKLVRDYCAFLAGMSLGVRR